MGTHVPSDIIVQELCKSFRQLSYQVESAPQASFLTIVSSLTINMQVALNLILWERPDFIPRLHSLSELPVPTQTIPHPFPMPQNCPHSPSPLPATTPPHSPSHLQPHFLTPIPSSLR